MSRSYKKNPIFQLDGWMSKTDANRIVRAKVRRTMLDEDAFLPQGNQYRRIVDQYEIKDYVSYWTLESAKQDYQVTERFHRMYPDEKTFLNKCWAKHQKRK